LLSSLYRYGSMAYVGGGFEEGIHNILEAAVYGIPVVFGPRYKKFNEAVDLIRQNGAYTIRTGHELVTCMERWIANVQTRQKEGATCLRYVKEHLGATETILERIT